MNWWVAILVAVIAATPATLAWLQSRTNHHMMNSRLDEVIQLTSRIARARGRREGRAAEKRTKG